MNTDQEIDQREYQTKERILERLYERASVCDHCGKKSCPHKGSRRLMGRVHVDDVLWAISLDKPLFRENTGE